MSEQASGDAGRLGRLIAGMAFLVVLSGVGNRIAYKVMLVPLEQFPYLISQISSVLYVILFLPFYAHAASRDGLAFWAPLKRHWRLLACMGALDGVGDLLGLLETPRSNRHRFGVAG